MKSTEMCFVRQHEVSNSSTVDMA